MAVVAGATRGAGRGIACMLGEAGATVYCTGRSTRANRIPGARSGSPHDLGLRPETIEETGELVTAHGGVGLPLRVDHTVPGEVEALFRRVREEQGRLDLLVNDIWGGEDLAEWGKPFWEQSFEKGLRMQQLAVHTHILTSQHAAPLLIETGGGLVIEITDGAGLNYRSNFFYDLAKISVIRLAFAMSRELAPHRVAALALTPGFLRSEAMLEHFGVTESTWRDGIATDPHFAESETPFFVGRAVAALAADPRVMERTGRSHTSWDLSEVYGFDDIDGRRPHWGRHFAKHFPELAHEPVQFGP